MLSGFVRICEKERTVLGELVKQILIITGALANTPNFFGATIKAGY